ncbi:mitochondrial f1f0 atp synthase subunit f [Ophiostoma piceae UAMH 11346]|uniref:Mitochondrial f1f0 atp synthase subunit f n=1 Tax=Ophiostoma piceae (strain UAMH 11346) TaxID=1262450 RepID=S3DB36_OPHP1|nr:mitochondrial f1f0 atp synthase subunit f [Ophiostoma piceae UAMH 11346]
MSYITRRALSTLIPPKVASPKLPAPWNRTCRPRRGAERAAEFCSGDGLWRLLGEGGPTTNYDDTNSTQKVTSVVRNPADTNIRFEQAIGAAPDAVRMQRVVSFYEKLPRGPAPEVKAKGILGRYQAKHFGKNPTAKPIVQVLVVLILVGYAQQYYFHLRHHKNNAH